MLTSAVVFLCSLAILANSLCILNHMTRQTSHVVRGFYTLTATGGFALVLMQPLTLHWWLVLILVGLTVMHLLYEPEFVKRRHIPWLFGDGHRRGQ